MPTRKDTLAGETTPAIVAKCGGMNGIAAIRSLGRRGVPVVAVDYSRGAIGFASRYCQASVCPDPATDAAGFVEHMLELSDRLGRPAPIFPANDDMLNALGRNEANFDGKFLSPFPRWDRLSLIQTKRYQVARAHKLGIPVPRTVYQPTDELGFPVLVKPSHPAEFQRVFGVHSFRCTTLAELEDAFIRAQAFDPLIQEWIPGGDDELYSVGAYVSTGGEILGLFSGRKLLQMPPGVGKCRIGESVWVDELVEQTTQFLRGLDYRGLAHVEFKRDPRDGRYKLMEINARLWHWHGLAAASGVDLTYMAYRNLLGDCPARATSENRRRKRWVLTLASGFRPVITRPPYVEAVVARDDPRPAFVHAWRVLRVHRSIRVAYRLARFAIRPLVPARP